MEIQCGQLKVGHCSSPPYILISESSDWACGEQKQDVLEVVKAKSGCRGEDSDCGQNCVVYTNIASVTIPEEGNILRVLSEANRPDHDWVESSVCRQVPGCCAETDLKNTISPAANCGSRGYCVEPWQIMPLIRHGLPGFPVYFL